MQGQCVCPRAAQGLCAGCWVVSLYMQVHTGLCGAHTPPGCCLNTCPEAIQAVPRAHSLCPTPCQGTHTGSCASADPKDNPCQPKHYT